MTKQEQHQQAEHNFRNHPPKDEEIAQKFDNITDLFLDTAHYLIDTIPDGREKSLMMTNLEQASMWAKAGLARNQDS